MAVVANAATGATVAIPAHVAGDAIYIFAYRDGSAALPTKPAAGGTVPAWVDEDTSAGANLNSSRLARFIATGSTHTSGTWTNATGMIAVVVPGVDTADPTGSIIQGGSASAADIAVPALPAQEVTTGTSTILHFGGHRTVTAFGAAPAGYTKLASAATEVCVYSKDVTTSDGALTMTATCSGNGGYRAISVEVRAAAATVISKTPAGGIVLGGSVAVSRARAQTPAGGIRLGGTLAVSRSRDVTIAGGIRLGGTLAVSRSRDVAVAGGIRLGGSVAVTRTRDLSTAGGIVLGGTVSTSRARDVATGGGIVLGGALAVARVRAVGVAGGIILGGSLAESTTRTFAAAGGIRLGGTLALDRSREQGPAGGLVLGGTLFGTLTRDLQGPAGGIVLGGSAASVVTLEGGKLTVSIRARGRADLDVRARGRADLTFHAGGLELAVTVDA